MSLVTKPDHGAVLINKEGQATSVMQNFLDDLQLQLNNNLLGKSVKLPPYTVATLPDASEHTGCQVYVSNESGGAVPAFSDGTNWRRVTDRAVVS